MTTEHRILFTLPEDGQTVCYQHLHLYGVRHDLAAASTPVRSGMVPLFDTKGRRVYEMPRASAEMLAAYNLTPRCEACEADAREARQ